MCEALDDVTDGRGGKQDTKSPWTVLERVTEHVQPLWNHSSDATPRWQKDNGTTKVPCVSPSSSDL